MDVLNSKSFWSSLAMIFAMGVVSVVPELADNQEQLVGAFTALGLALVAGHKGKDILMALVEALIGNTNIADELTLNEEEAPTDA